MDKEQIIKDLECRIENHRMNMYYNECADDFYHSNGRYRSDMRILADLEEQLRNAKGETK